jgi:hypothetical protein
VVERKRSFSKAQAVFSHRLFLDFIEKHFSWGTMRDFPPLLAHWMLKSDSQFASLLLY